MRYLFIGIWLLCCSVTSAIAQVSVSIGINLPLYPELVRVPGYPVYYAPRLESNYFFYDGMYWVYQDDTWYASTWYNGPWDLVNPQYVPLFVLRIPVRYYRSPPPYFRPWRADGPPRWGEHWGREWEQRRSGWDRWNHRSAPAPAPLPAYQRQYSGDRYPQQIERQQALRDQNYRYQPRDPAVREHRQAPARPASREAAPAQRAPVGAPPDRSAQHQDVQRPSPPPRSDPGIQRPAPPQATPRPKEAEGRDQKPRSEPRAAPREQRVPAAHPKDKPPREAGGPPQHESNRGQGQGQGKNDRDRGDDRRP